MRAAFYFDSTAVRIFRSNVFDGKADCFSHDVSQPYVSLRVCGIITAFCAPMAQRIEHRTSNPTVAGSSPAGRARIFWPERDMSSPAFLLSKAECILARSRTASTMVNFPMPHNADAPLRDFPEEALFRSAVSRRISCAQLALARPRRYCDIINDIAQRSATFG